MRHAESRECGMLNRGVRHAESSVVGKAVGHVDGEWVGRLRGDGWNML